VMTHSHALDSLITGVVLERGDFRYLGLIGSQSKAARFRSAFRGMGLPEERIARLICPIGGTEVQDKRPEVIATLAAAEIIKALMGNEKHGEYLDE
jgi:xanthine dehydrogenase accessory factor